MELYNENIARLIQRSLLGELTERERQELEAWLKDSREHGVLFNKVKRDMRVSVESPVFCSLNDEFAWLKFKTITRKRKRQVVIWQMLKYVAVIAVPLIISVFWYLGQRDNVVKLASRSSETIVPGESKAVLVAADGKIHELNGKQEQQVIEVGEGVLVKHGGSNLVYDSVVAAEHENILEMNTLRIPRGGEFQLTLSDGTVIYLNSATKLKYPVAFNGKERKVYLSGEAYFEVAKDVERPFYVVTDELEIRVYGTEFNVDTRGKGGVRTVLVNGKIGARDRRGKYEVLMKQGELATLDRKTGEIVLREVDVRRYIAWKDGFFAFEEESLEEIMNTLSLWYNVDVFFQSESVKGLVFTGYMRRYSDVMDILDAITDVVDVHFDVNGRTIIVSK
ncbi:FecR family protein [Butyricimonas synergistica]|uniref:FecR family protein n=1 Tax=Butyricimonas synergistica TaxID=544644 RepID=UPI00037CCC96|nr:FecR family protein [Butyricimonas synergistica]